jgi:hypothetical protein
MDVCTVNDPAQESQGWVREVELDEDRLKATATIHMADLHPWTSKGVPPSCSASSITLSASTHRISASASTNLLINQGQAVRSTLAFLRVTHFTD